MVIHASKMFGFEILDSRILKKTILFPMFLSPSYCRSGESVPKEYTELEKSALKCVGQIITPSQSEKEDISHNYQVNPQKIHIIPRGVDDAFFSEGRFRPGDPLGLITVSSIKPQKNVIESLFILNRLSLANKNVHLTIIGRVESEQIYKEMLDYIVQNALTDRVTIIFGCSLGEVAESMRKADILILPSLWETFGRVVYEGFAAGLPALVRPNIECFSELEKNEFVFPYRSLDEAVQIITDFSVKERWYEQLSKKASNFALQYRSDREKTSIREVIQWPD